VSRITLTADELYAALMDVHGNVTMCAERLGLNRASLCQMMKRRGVDITAVRKHARQRTHVLGGTLTTVTPAVSGDSLPSARPVLASVLVDMAELTDALLATQADLEQSNRIIAILTRELEARAA
jgi:hypothetical protein